MYILTNAVKEIPISYVFCLARQRQAIETERGFLLNLWGFPFNLWGFSLASRGLVPVAMFCYTACIIKQLKTETRLDLRRFY